MNAVLNICLVFLSLGLMLCLARLLRGPSLADRMMALDTMVFNLIGVVAVVSVRQGTDAFLALAIVFSLLSFVGTVAVSRFLGGGTILE